MKVCDLSTLSELDYILKDISSIHRAPQYTSFSTPSRVRNGFLLIESGECVYKWGTEHLKLRSGDIIYLPQYSNHKMRILSKKFSFYRIDFKLFSPKNEVLVFSSHPQLIYRDVEQTILDKVIHLTELFHDTHGYFKSKSILYELFDIFSNAMKKVTTSQITPALEFLQQHYTEHINTSYLCQLCALSKAQLYRIFKAQVGFTPIDYKNSLRIKRAKIILRGDICNITQTAELLGFENAYYFSRMFKKYTGLSPTKYRNNYIQKDI